MASDELAPAPLPPGRAFGGAVPRRKMSRKLSLLISPGALVAAAPDVLAPSVPSLVLRRFDFGALTSCSFCASRTFGLS